MSDLLTIAETIEDLVADDAEGHAEANGRMWCALDPATRRFIAISPGGEPWYKYEGGRRMNTTSRGLVFERMDYGTKSVMETGAQFQQYPSSPRYTQRLDVCATACGWLVAAASEMHHFPGRCMVNLYSVEQDEHAVGFGSTLAAAWAAAVCRAKAFERGDKGELA